jgi:molybdate transport system substrate-binding protein
MPRGRAAALLLAGWACLAPALDGAEPAVAIAAAADLKFALDEVVEAFRRQRPDLAVTVSYGSSGGFYAQLSHRAPFDLFFSADRDFVERLAAQGATLAGSEFGYAVGHLALWVPEASPLAIESQGLAALADPRVRRVAIANPRHAPYGRAAEAALRSLGVYDQVADKLVLGESVAQAAQFAQSGAADAAIIALSLALAPTLRDSGRHWRLPDAAHPRLEQAAVILRWARDPEAARALSAFVLAPAGREILARYGFDGFDGFDQTEP